MSNITSSKEAVMTGCVEVDKLFGKANGFPLGRVVLLGSTHKGLSRMMTGKLLYQIADHTAPCKTAKGATCLINIQKDGSPSSRLFRFGYTVDVVNMKSHEFVAGEVTKLIQRYHEHGKEVKLIVINDLVFNGRVTDSITMQALQQVAEQRQITIIIPQPSSRIVAQCLDSGLSLKDVLVSNFWQMHSHAVSFADIELCFHTRFLEGDMYKTTMCMGASNGVQHNRSDDTKECILSSGFMTKDFYQDMAKFIE